MIAIVIGGLGLLYGRRWAAAVTAVAAIVIVAAPISDGLHFVASLGIVPQLLYYSMPLFVLFALARSGRRFVRSRQRVR